MKTIAFEGDFPVSQIFGVNPAAYARFGLNGHNGVDFAAPTGTTLLAVESGTAQVGSDPTGYGIYIKLVADSGWSYIYGHMESPSVFVANGERVVIGQPLGRSDNTGNSTGPHLHFGSKPPNADATNGFGGYVDPMPRLAELENDMTRVQELEEQVASLTEAVGQRDGTISSLQNDFVTPLREEIRHLRDEVIPAIQSQIDGGGGSDSPALQDLRDRLAKIDAIATQ